ncbi:MAG TPA: dihydrolipoamide acetyltransferase family protein [Candidatus Acidoferrales bacterium]|nr:dihydrolipoamide acetyltransferase family protein [Candidatus Acidoferrales bacterium]
MATDVIMPQMGESIFEGTVTKWLKKPGEKVERDEPLFEISTDKVDAEIPSPAAGVLKEIKVAEGQTVPIQTVVGVIDADGAGAGSAAPAPAPAAAEAKPQAKAEAKSETRTEARAETKAEVDPEAKQGDEKPSPASAPTETEAVKADSAKGAATGAPAQTGARPAPAAAAGAGPSAPPQRPAGEKIRSSPLVRRLAKENSVDLGQVPGTGAGGRVSKRDILSAIEGGGAQAAAAPATSSAPAARPPMPPPPPAAAGGQRRDQAHTAFDSAVPRERMYFGNYSVEPMSVMRQRIAEHMVASKRVSPHVYSIDEADVTGIVKLRSQKKDEFERTTGSKLTYMPFFIRAAVEALHAFPTVNSSVDGTNIVFHRECNIGIAVALDWGLIVPVVKSAEEKNFLGLQRAINDLAERARSKKLKPEEVQEGTFSITNPGVFGGLMGLPVISQPNVAILGLGTIEKRPVVIDDAIAIRSMVYLTLSYDHRVVDGAIAHQFMGKIKNILENWSEGIL